MKKVLITGVAGFVGSHTARRFLDEGWIVYGIDNFSKGYKENIEDMLPNGNFIFIAADIRDVNLAKRYARIELDCVYHLAAVGDIPKCLSDPVDAVNNNIVGSLNILDVAYKTNAKHIYFADTSAVYDGISDERIFPLRENAAPNSYSPNSVYAITKTCAASLLQTFCKRFGIGYTGFRYSNIYGPSMDLTREVPPVIGGLAKKIINNEQPIIYGDGSKVREFVYIDDLVELHYTMSEQMDSKRIITLNVGSGRPITIKDLYYVVWDICNQLKLGAVTARDDIDWRPERPDEAKRVELDRSVTRGISNGWDANTSLEDGIRKTIKSIM